MPEQKVYLGKTPYKTSDKSVNGGYVELDGELFYKISDYHRMRPFFMSIVGHSDHWLFISSTGGLSAGRKNEDSPLFPYYTDDKISESSETTGSKTLVKVYRENRIYLWEPFSIRTESSYSISRNLFKNLTGNKIVFEEINRDLGLAFWYSWQLSEKYGFVKQSGIRNMDDRAQKMEILDGVRNILPYGISSDFQNRTSNLANAYKKNELDRDTGLGIFVLSSMIVDKAEPSEALKATTVWNGGLKMDDILLSSLQLDQFREGKKILTETDIRAEPGSYFVNMTVDLGKADDRNWFLVAEVNQDHSNVVNLNYALKERKEHLINDLTADIEAGTQSLRNLVGIADGLQLTGDQPGVGRHYSNVLFNIMRGGVFADQYHVEKKDLIDYISMINRNLQVDKSQFFDSLAEDLHYQDLIELAEKTGDPDLIRICYEYLPLSFSRRHGDPSRPWNKFSIETKKEDGSANLYYQGNWRDIFQNWEALGISFPGYLISMITKFVNASTVDGYNPYRITREGIDWEVIEPDDPWSYIGYWGDHQIIYLLKLMESAVDHHEEAFSRLLSAQNFVYTNVPYRIKPYEDILKDPQNTIDFDDKEALTIEERVSEKGADGKLLHAADENLIRANLTEKLLVALLAKLYNFIPEGGIWMNTQRPEWNDANNALVGNGVSMVTLYYLRRFVSFCLELYSKDPDRVYQINRPVSELFEGIHDVLESNSSLLNAAISSENRKLIIDDLGRLGEIYRSKAYRGFSNDATEITVDKILDFLRVTLHFLDHSIQANRRADGLYHAYNLIHFDRESATIDHLYEMLEGQVAVLSAGLLNFEEALEVLDALKNSKIFREDQYSYMLYPDRDLPRFLDKNRIPKSFIEGSKLARTLLDNNDTSIILEDAEGGYHFNGTFNNAGSLSKALNALDDSYLDHVKAEYESYLHVFEEMFNHKAFTGRSGTFFGYEGLGSIYWHMVSKLLLATQENIYWAKDEYVGTEIMGRMIDHYYEIRAGIGINKSPELYGSFPTDPYSHTPGNKGAQQPGMTGQVKEDILNRWAELGVRVHNSCISFEPFFLSEMEFLKEPSSFGYFDVGGLKRSIEVGSNELAFTYCQVPVIYKKSASVSITIQFSDGRTEELVGVTLGKELSGEIFRRSGQLAQIRVYQPFD